MKLETLKERIANAKTKIEKKQNTITKKTALIEKKKAQIAKLGNNRDAEWLACDIECLTNDIERATDEIEAIKESIQKYEAQLAGEMERESILIKEIPESMKRMQAELVAEWDAWDKNRRDELKKAYSDLGYRMFFQKYNRADYEFKSLTDDQIHKNNERDAKMLILNLYYRVKDITGEVVDWSGIQADIGTHGFTVLTGYVIGKEGRAYVESILAGGYNIQRLHVRVLVHER